MALGATAVGIAALAPFVVAGAFADFWNSAVVYTLKYVGDTSATDRIGATLFSVIPLLLFVGPWVILSTLAVLQARKGTETEKLWLVVGWLCASFAAIILVGRFYSHYFVQTLPGMALLVPAGFAYVRDTWRRSFRLRLLYSLGFSLLTVSALAFSLNAYTRPSPSARHLAKHPGDLSSEFEVESPALADYIREHTSAEDKIYNLGFQTELYFYAQRDSPSKFLFDRPFGADSAYIREAVHDLEMQPPRYIIDSASYDGWMKDHYDPAPIFSFISARYDYVGKIYYADVYKLREVTSAP